ncbi:MAG: XRE family transcriptional regulator [Candidatus Fimadaptatus sp.]|nr:XRE family transcriptional regulator [Candidatus Fimadaptatus sp.]
MNKKPTPFGKYIKKRLIDLDMRQCDLAAAIGTTPPMVTYIIYGERDANVWIEPICVALGDGDKADKYARRWRRV